MKRFPVSKRRSVGEFVKNRMRVKAANLQAGPMRGGIRF